jgi:hypothetical protein
MLVLMTLDAEVSEGSRDEINGLPVRRRERGEAKSVSDEIAWNRETHQQ